MLTALRLRHEGFAHRRDCRRQVDQFGGLLLVQIDRHLRSGFQVGSFQITADNEASWDGDCTALGCQSAL